ncbi:hypothetical protein [Streptomyces luteogriseus]
MKHLTLHPPASRDRPETVNAGRALDGFDFDGQASAQWSMMVVR